ncbi:phospholipase D [Mycena maculata]|uniref:Phospholipase n=1 Tax=Mycena maculata TaxID=230809 RepID=A0AAD7J7B3_9AGAR|nr:phospholipase D [Mycena maculata]
MADTFASVVNAAVEQNDGKPSTSSSSSAQPSPRIDARVLNTPSTRTGPPRSLSYGMSLPSSPISGPRAYRPDMGHSADIMEDGKLGFSFARDDGFRTPLEMPETYRKGKKRESRILDDSWNPLKWFQDSPPEDNPGFFTSQEVIAEPEQDSNTEGDEEGTPPRAGIQRASTAPHSPSDKPKTAPKWGRLRSLIPHIASQANGKASTPGPSVVAPQAVNITDELIAGGLSTLMLRMWFERDEKGHRRIPALFHRLRLRVTDSLNPLHGQKSVFRIECEYANGSIRWVVYRQLRDFFSLHTHYALSNAYNRNVDDLPEFPKTSLPYYKFLKREDKDLGHKDFARMQREKLETYLLNLIRAVMFHPAANRLAGFLEVSALFINLAPAGGLQLKAGYLRIESTKTGGGFGRKSTTWREKKESRWCAVRDSYIVVIEEPGELDIWDVFLLDADFEIERPKRYYRQGLKLLHPDTNDDKDVEPPNNLLHAPQDNDTRSVMGSVRSTFSKMLRRNANGTAGDDARSSTSSGSSVSSIVSEEPAPMLDPSTNTNPLSGATDQADADRLWHPDEKKKRVEEVSKHTFYIVNSQMRLKLFARNQRQMLQWITALEKVKSSAYCQPNRFDSFSPIRLNVAAQWLVDGRDYFWNLSRALLLARETIYIHDWWLSPELQLRRPNKDRYRLDRLLERKAKEGVKIYVILYQEVSNRTTPTDSNYAKQRLTALHPNILVQRSPSHFQTGTFYWAHHEKMCVIDQTIAFMGGLDLCFGRWDTPQHVIIDDVDAGGENSEIWPGKDYSNPRLSDFHTLNKPEEDMYDRSKIPRMPWHDVAMQVVGQPARDLCRHFVQRWNYLLRIKNHTRIMPFLLPPPEFKPGELTEMQLTGTCEMQLCRSAGPWSLGTKKTEHSIQNAYLKAIQLSEHFVYIENQFFITSTVVNDTKVENKIGDAIVRRIIRAHHDGMPWKCCIMLPVFPGFAFPVDHSDASAIRIILECQNRTIARGPNSIFSRLRKEGIDPDEYISVFSLRNWGKLRGDVLSTEQVYIHAKICIVDDRLAIIGSANINERSQRGDRDSELAAVIRDTDMIDSTMAGKPFQVGRFAHSLRVRLMREHLGVDVDALEEDHLMAKKPVKPEHEQDKWIPDADQNDGYVKESKTRTALGSFAGTVKDGIEQGIHGSEEASSNTVSKMFRKVGLVHNSIGESAGDEMLDAERKTYARDGTLEEGFASAMVPTLEEKTVIEQRPPKGQADGSPVEEKLQNEPDTGPSENGNTVADEAPKPNGDGPAQEDGKPAQLRTDDGELYGAPADASGSAKTDDQPPHARSGVDDANEEEKKVPGARSILRRHLGAKLGNKTWTLPTPRPKVDPNGFEDPICDEFWKNVWVASATHNTEIYRKVFHAIPDDLVTTWKQYKEFVVHHERMNKSPRDSTTPEAVARVPSETGDEGAISPDAHGPAGPAAHVVNHPGKSTPHSDEKTDEADKEGGESPPDPGLNASASEKRKSGRSTGTEPFEKWERDEMEKLLGQLNGHLVLYSNRFLEGEDVANNFLFNADRLLPLPIYD